MLDTKYGMKYSFPHTLVHIVDNSAYNGDLPVVLADDPSMFGTIVVSGFPMGEDRRVINITRSDILNVAYGLGSIGATDVKKYGQTITYPLSLIDQGAPIQLLRVTPPDATYAYSCITIEWRWDTEKKEMHVRYNSAKLDSGRDLMQYATRDRLAAAVMKSVPSEVTVDGETWTRRAFIVNVSAGRGSAYNSYTTTIDQTLQSKRPANAMYLFSTVNTATNTTVEQYHASLVNINNPRTDSIDGVNTIMKKRAPGSSVAVQFLNEEAIQELYNEYRAHFADMLNDRSFTVTDYVAAVDKTLTVNTFDPIFGLYLYGGTDQNAKLPFFQVDMHLADIPKLDEANRVCYKESDLEAYGADEKGKFEANQIGTKLMDLTTGVSSPTDQYHIGDVFLYSGTTSRNNPFLYIIAAINQYTGAVTTVRTNKLRYISTSGVTINTPSELGLIIETDKVSTMSNKLADALRVGYIKDGETFAWYNPSAGTWSLHYINPGCAALASTNQLAITNDNIEEFTPTYDTSSYNFIGWDQMNAGTIIATDIAYRDTAWTRPGSTCINIQMPFDEATAENPVVYVNGYDVHTVDTQSPPFAGVKYAVAARTQENIFKYGAPPTTITTVGSATGDVMGTEFDAIECDDSPTSIVAYSIINNAQFPVTVPATDLPIEPYPDTNPYGLIGPALDQSIQLSFAFKSEGAQSNTFRFAVKKDESDGALRTAYLLYETTDTELIREIYTALGLDSTEKVVVFPALAIEEGYYDGTAKKFYRNYGAPAWDTTKYYWTAATGGTAVATKPADWNTSYASYYVSDTEEGERTAVTAVYTNEISGNLNNIYHDNMSGQNKYYWFDATSTPYKEAVVDGVSANADNIVFWYKQSSSGSWNIYPSSSTPGFCGYAIDILGGTQYWESVIDERTAMSIDRYTVIGTIGSLYRIQQNAITIAEDYYSDQYGINFTSSDGGIMLEEGSTGFFDNPNTTITESIAYKWNYSMLLVEAFRGRIDPTIMSPTRCQAKYLFDGGWNTIIGQSSLPTMQYSAADIITASTLFTEEEKDEVLFNPDLTNDWTVDVNKSIDVKQAMYDLMDYRIYQGIPEDMRPVGPGSGMSLHLDSGVTDATTALTINNSFRKRFDNPNASWDIGGYVSSVDGISYTYIKRIVDNMFRHLQAFTINKPFVMTYSSIYKDEYVSFFPEIDTTDWDYRELMYNSGGNAWIPDVNGTLMRRSQRTLMRGSDTSDLIQESNMRTLTQLVYLLQNKLESKLFEYNDDSVLRTMQDEVTNMFSNWVGSLVDGLTINFERDINPVDGGELVVCYVNVVFRGINLRIPIIVNVNRRTVSNTTT